MKRLQSVRAACLAFGATILPTHAAFNFRPQSITKNELVLSGLGVHHFIRGAFEF